MIAGKSQYKKHGGAGYLAVLLCVVTFSLTQNKTVLIVVLVSTQPSPIKEAYKWLADLLCKELPVKAQRQIKQNPRRHLLTS